MTKSVIAVLPQRGCILQPRVAVPSQPWVNDVRYPNNPNGVASTGRTDATVIVLRLFAFGLFNQASSAVSARSNSAAGNARVFGRRLEDVGVPSVNRGRRRRSCSPALSNVPHHHASRFGEGAQTRFQPLDQATRSRFIRIRMAGRIRRVFGQPVRVGTNHPLHCQSGTTSPKTILSRRIQSVPAQTRHGMGRTLRLGMTWRLPDPSVWRPVKDTTPLGLRQLTRRFPGVASKPQRRAGGSNPFGIPKRQRFTLLQQGNVPEPIPSTPTGLRFPGPSIRWSTQPRCGWHHSKTSKSPPNSKRLAKSWH